MFKILSTCRGGGYIQCRTDPPHPNRNAMGLVKLHRVVVENHIGRLLTVDEHVHHKDEDVAHNEIDNLQIVSNSEHKKIHAAKKPAKLVFSVCPVCKTTFSGSASNLEFKLKQGKTPCCSRKCMGASSSHSKSEEVILAIKKLRIEGNSVYVIAKELGISRNTVMKYWGG